MHTRCKYRRWTNKCNKTFENKFVLLWAANMTLEEQKHPQNVTVSKPVLHQTCAET